MASTWDLLALVRSRRFHPPSAKLTVLTLASYCDDRWSCFVGQTRLAAEVGVSDRTIRTLLSGFEKAGVLRREKRYGGLRGRTSDRIFLLRDGLERLPKVAFDLPEVTSARRPHLAATPGVLPEAEPRSGGSSHFRVTTSGESPVVSSPEADDPPTAQVLLDALDWSWEACDPKDPRLFMWTGEEDVFDGLDRDRHWLLAIREGFPFTCDECAQPFNVRRSRSPEAFGWLHIWWIPPDDPTPGDPAKGRPPDPGSPALWSGAAVCRTCAVRTGLVAA